MTRSTKRTASALEQEEMILRWVYGKYFPRTPLDPSYGDELSYQIGLEAYERFEGVVHHRLLERVCAEIQDRLWVPRDSELTWEFFDWKFKQLEKRIIGRPNANALGDPFIAEEVKIAMSHLESTLDRLNAKLGARGHNGCPEKDEATGISPQSLVEVQNVMTGLRQSFSSGKQSAKDILNAARALNTEAANHDRLSDIVDIGVDSFAREYGGQLGKNAANATTAFFGAVLWLTFLLVAYLTTFFLPVDTNTHQKSVSVIEDS